MSGVFLSPQGRVSFPSVYEASKVAEDDKSAKFSITLVIDHNNLEGEQRELLELMKESCNDVATEAFGVEMGQEDADGTVIKSPFRSTDSKKKYYGDMPGQVFIRFSNKYAPQILDGNKRPIPQSSGQFYPGCWAHVSYTCYPYTYMGNKGISLSLNNVQKTGDDEPFGGQRTSAEDDFDVIATPKTDEIPF